MASSSAAPTATQATTNDFLEDDIVTVPGQVYALVSIVSPRSNQKSDTCAIKIRGVFGTRPEAEAHVRKIMKFDSDFDVFIVDMYKWLPVPPDLSKIEDQEYTQTELNDLIKGYKESQLEAKQHFLERKRIMQEQGLDAVLTEEERLPPPTSTSLPDVFIAPSPHPAESQPSTSASASASAP